MVILQTLGCLTAILCLWALPIYLGIKAAKKNHRSPHWMWLGVHPFGAWIAFLVLQFAAPQKSCSKCGERVKAHAKLCPYCITPFEELPTAQLPSPAEKKRKWVMISGVATAGVLGLAGFIMFTMNLVESSFKDSGAYQQAIQKASADARVVELLGSPITGGSMSSGSISTSGDATGEADLSIPISGPKGSARLYASGKLHAGVWSWQTLEIDPKNGQPRIKLLSQN
jgi:hypothetical protein